MPGFRFNAIASNVTLSIISHKHLLFVKVSFE